MRVALAAVGFKTGDMEHNKNRIIKVMKSTTGLAELVLFGETFLQGFECLSWVYEKDKDIAVTQDCELIGEIRQAAIENDIAVSFGYVERDGERLYSSQLTIGRNGETINNYRRVSVGWREQFTDGHYCEGEDFPSFTFEGRTLSVGLCGDFWSDELIARMNRVKKDIILWPVYTDFNYSEWNSSVKLEYADQAGLLGGDVLYVNSYCLDHVMKENEELARGGAVWFHDGVICRETLSGSESVLIVRV